MTERPNGLFYIVDQDGAFRTSAIVPSEPVFFSRADYARNYIREAGDPALRIVLVQPIDRDTQDAPRETGKVLGRIVTLPEFGGATAITKVEL